VNHWLSQVATKNILVIGDTMLDIYYFGTMDRMSPEANVPVLDIDRIDVKLGGAANVACNIKSMKASVYLYSIAGEDEGCRELTSKLLEYHIPHRILVDPSRKTTKKTRVYQKGEYKLRIDDESLQPISSDMEKTMIEELIALLDSHSFDAVIFQDYNKGLFTKTLIHSFSKILNERNLPIIVDPKKDHFFEYINCTLFKPNLKELSIATNCDVDSSQWIPMVSKTQQCLGCQYVLLTLSEQGALLYTADKQTVHIPAYPRNIVDVSGAGDTVLAIATLALATNCSPEEIVRLANFAGGVVCERLGVSTILPEDFQSYQ